MPLLLNFVIALDDPLNKLEKSSNTIFNILEATWPVILSQHSSTSDLNVGCSLVSKVFGPLFIFRLNELRNELLSRLFHMVRNGQSQYRTISQLTSN